MITSRSKEATFNGTTFKSTLEARWAVFFDTLQILYKYEPIVQTILVRGEFRNYCPDFWLPTLGIWVEIKPHGLADIPDLARLKLEGLARCGYRTVLLSGEPTKPQPIDEITDRHYLFTRAKNPQEVTVCDRMWWAECDCGGFGLAHPKGWILGHEECERDLESDGYVLRKTENLFTNRLVFAYESAKRATFGRAA